jgi:putative sterol carrier protein
LEATTPKEFFEKLLPKQFNPTKAVGVDVVVQISITGTDSGEWTVVIKDQKLNVCQGIHPKPTLSLKMAEKDYLDLVNHKISAENAFFTGKVKFKGNIATALRLREAGFL